MSPKVLDLSTLKAAKRVGKASRMNGLESAYAMELDAMQRAGEIIAWRFEGLKLRLASNTFYTPDFLVIRSSGVELIEAKGFWRDDARVKIKVAAEMYPWFRFSAVQKIPKKQGGGWKVEHFAAAALATPRGQPAGRLRSDAMTPKTYYRCLPKGRWHLAHVLDDYLMNMDTKCGQFIDLDHDDCETTTTPPPDKICRRCEPERKSE